MQPVAAHLKEKSFSETGHAQREIYQRRGFEAIASGHVGVILLAGGQGTRLGVSYPKGMFSVDLLSKKTLFQIQAERLLKVKQLTGSSQLPWYIMTSGATFETTIDFFRKNNYFGLASSDVVFFEQGTSPCFGYDGKIILDRKYKISRAPDGNGGLYRALLREGMLDDMARKGLKYVHVYCVDNILTKMADPVFTGFCLAKEANCGSKVVRKSDPEEKVGVICRVGDSHQVVEYSEISHTTRNSRDEQSGELVYDAGNICNHFMTTEFLNQICRNYSSELKDHVAEKKIPFIDDDGLLQKPLVNNGIKLEKFVFDVFPFSNAPWASGTFALWEVLRQDEFSPLKHGIDAKSDNPISCCNDLMDQHLRWLQEAGGRLERSTLEQNDSSPPRIEISSLVSYNGENLASLVNGKSFREPLFIDYNKKENKITFNGLDIESYQKSN
jgi:UDP-N-acetylglucosamine/UDP-N-acetylgalactosamine diphosphorylase